MVNFLFNINGGSGNYEVGGDFDVQFGIPDYEEVAFFSNIVTTNFDYSPGTYEVSFIVFDSEDDKLK